MPKIAPFLWFDDQAEEAAEFYVSVFNARPGSAGDSEILGVARYGEGGPGKPGSAMTVSFRLEGQEFTGLNGGPHHQFTEAVSFLVNCETQEEVDALWSALSEGGEAGPVRLAEGPLRPVLADHPDRAGRAPRRPRPRAGGAGPCRRCCR